MKRRLFLPILTLLLLLTCGCMPTGQEVTEPTKPYKASLNEVQQRLADNIWEQRSIWSGAEQLEIYRLNNDYYLAANFRKRTSSVSGLGSGGAVEVATYKKYVYRIVNQKIVDDLTLADEGILTYATKLKSIWFESDDTEEDKIARISQLVTCY